ncbi:SURF1-like protein [Rhodococcoides trifolii]|uniref:SURF1-like protein n=1 Tax=Rhodococcoides trifolii TaxID=908250 RepID=A0A917D1Y3_9NOCA|nr:SURF1 family protein [Rhodococcus trifolii]GGG04816.1 SURF1-like protein [Rhodococcus trifolii]
MRRLSYFLKPGWLVLAGVVALFAYLCFSILAPWQLGKNSTTTERNDQIARSLEADPVPADALISGGQVTTDDDWRRVTLAGTFTPNADVLVRLRSVNETPSYEVLTPFRTESGPTVVINRGYVLPNESNQPPTIDPPPTGQVVLDGRLRVDETPSPERNPIAGSGGSLPQVYSITAAQVGALTGTTPVDGYVQLADAQPGGLGTIALPQLDAGPYLSYGLQWIAFGIMAPLGLAYFVRAELRERRKEKQAPEPEPLVLDDDEHDDLDRLLVPRRSLRRKKSSPTTPTDATSSRMADRYGK